MAGAGYKLFNTGDVLTAAQVNTYLQEQTVMVFANSTARTTALSGVLAEGMMSYLQDTNAVEVYNGTSWVNVGNAGDITEVQAGVGISIASGTGPIPVITNSSTDLITTAGDLLYGTAADTVARLGIGTAGQVLKVNSGATAPEWATASSGGMTVIQTGTLSSTSVVISSIPGTYKHLLLTCYGFGTSTGANGDTPAIRLNGSTSSLYTFCARRSNNLTGGDLIDTARSALVLGNSANYSKTNLDNHFAVWFYDYANAANWPLGSFIYAFVGDDATINQASGVWSYQDLNAAITSITIKGDAGQTMNNGTYTLWGVS